MTQTHPVQPLIDPAADRRMAQPIHGALTESRRGQQ